MILSVSRRTDIPRWYSEWLLRRLRAGEVLVRNPYRPGQLRRVPLSPAVVDAIVFWTKDPAPLLPWLDELDEMGYRYLFQFTLTPYGPEIEPGLRDKQAIVETFQVLGRRLGCLFQRRAELTGGLVLIAIGVKILIEHLSGG